MPDTTPNRPDRERRTYLAERIKALQAEIKALRAEKRTVLEALRGQSDMLSPEAKKIKQRRLYLTKRPDEAKAELETMMKEHKALSGKVASAKPAAA